MLFMVAMASIAAFNALTFSLAMEQTVLSHVRTPPAIVQQCPAFKVLVNPFSPHVHSAGAGYLASRFSSRKNSAKLAARLGGFADAFAAHAAPNVTQAFEDKRCAAMNYNPYAPPYLPSVGLLQRLQCICHRFGVMPHIPDVLHVNSGHSWA